MLSRLTLLLITLLAVNVTASGQTKISTKDSLAIKNQIEGFYSWYFEMIKGKSLNHFNPRFVRRKDGMTTLDFAKYQAGLKKYNFSDDFIRRKVGEYKKCVDNLNKIPFEKFSEFEDLDDFEDIECDFGNRYEWTGGMEPMDKATLSTLKPVDDKTIVGRVDFIYDSKPDGNASVTFKKVNKQWKVDNLTLK